MLIRNAIVSSSHERQIDIYRRGGGVHPDHDHDRLTTVESGPIF